MDRNLVYAKTPTGDEAVRQSTLVEDRNLRMVLVQVDGKLSVGELSLKIGNPPLVEWAIQELEKGGYIAPTLEAVSVWEESKRRAQQEAAPFSVFSEFSTFGPRAGDPPVENPASDAGKFSSFGKPIFPSVAKVGANKGSASPEAVADSVHEDAPERPAFRFKVGWLIWGLMGAVALLLAGAFLFPYDSKRTQIEAAASEFLAATVKIGKIDFGLSPRPALNLHDFRVGDKGETFGLVKISNPWALLFGGSPQLSLVESSGARVSVERLANLPFMQVSPPARRLSIRQINLRELDFLAGSIESGGWSGSVQLSLAQTVDKASFENADGTLRLRATPAEQGIALQIEGSGWRPAGSALRIDSLQGKAMVKTGRLLVQEFDGIALGGVVKGSWLFDWNFGLTMTGEASLRSLDSRKLAEWVAPALKLDGELSGSLRMRSAGKDLDSLWANADGTLAADITRGAFFGVDLGEALRRGGSGVSRAAVTKFDRLQVSVAFDPSRIVGRDLRLAAGILSAAGSFVANRDQRVDANLQVSLQTSASLTRAPVRLTGKLPDLIFADAK